MMAATAATSRTSALPHKGREEVDLLSFATSTAFSPQRDGIHRGVSSEKALRRLLNLSDQLQKPIRKPSFKVLTDSCPAVSCEHPDQRLKVWHPGTTTNLSNSDSNGEEKLDLEWPSSSGEQFNRPPERKASPNMQRSVGEASRNTNTSAQRVEKPGSTGHSDKAKKPASTAGKQRVPNEIVLSAMHPPVSPLRSPKTAAATKMSQCFTRSSKTDKGAVDNAHKSDLECAHGAPNAIQLFNESSAQLCGDYASATNPYNQDMDPRKCAPPRSVRRSTSRDSHSTPNHQSAFGHLSDSNLYSRSSASDRSDFPNTAKTSRWEASCGFYSSMASTNGSSASTTTEEGINFAWPVRVNPTNVATRRPSLYESRVTGDRALRKPRRYSMDDRNVAMEFWKGSQDKTIGDEALSASYVEIDEETEANERGSLRSVNTERAADTVKKTETYIERLAAMDLANDSASISSRQESSASHQKSSPDQG